MPASPRVPRAARQAALLLLFIWLPPTDAPAASFPPSYRFQSLTTARLTVYFHQGLEPMAREAAALAEQILAAHEARYRVRLGRLHVVIADNEDDPNGFATPLPYPLVSIRAASPDGSDDFGNLEGWLRLVLTHELAHSVHLDQARGVIRAGRKIFGRAPFLFPNALTPTWMIEGLATYEETEGTAFGRGRNPDSRMVRRMAALEERFPHQDQAVTGYDKWPGGDTAYLFGESFLRSVTARSPNALPDLARAQSGKIIPFLDDLTANEVTGATFFGQWADWKATSVRAFAREAEELGQQGLTVSRALTSVGIRQVGPRFSPDGSLIAYTSRTLTRYPALRVVRPDGSGDRKLTDRNGGSGSSWTPDGQSIVYDDVDAYRLFSRRSDLYRVDVVSGKKRRLTRGLRARDPDVSPLGHAVAFVRRMGDRSELCTLPLEGGETRTVTSSVPGTEWSSPRWSPQGDVLVASRLLPGGFLDLVEVDPERGTVTSLTEDRAKDVEPAYTPDGEHVVFRSDRDGVSNLYAVRRRDGTLHRLTNVLGGAFAPSVSSDGRTVAFSNYSSHGYDVHVAEVDFASAPAAAPFVDPYPASSPATEPVAVAATPYRPLPVMLPRFWSPVVLRQDDQWHYGAAIAGTDPLFRHSYGVTAYAGSTSGEVSTLAFYQYDRFWPTLLATFEDEARLSGNIPYRNRIFNLRATFPVTRSFRSAQNVSLTWRRERQAVDEESFQVTGALDRGGLEAAWAWSSTQQYAESVSPVDGGRLRFAFLREDPAFGSELTLSKFTGDARGYVRLFGERDVVAFRVGGGTTRGERGFRRTFAVGGYPDSSIFDLVRANEALLRGYPDDAFSGRHFAQANVEYRFPLASPQRGWRTMPLFLRHLRGTVFFDAANAWNGDLHLGDIKTGAGASLGVDTYLAHRLPFVGEMALAHGFQSPGDTRLYFRVGLAF